MKKISITQSYRDQLNVIAQGIDVNVNAMLNLLTTDQLTEVVQMHSHINWSAPNSDDKDNKLIGITQQPLSKQWVMEFKNSINWTDKFFLHDMDIQDVLAFMQTIETVLTPEPLTNEKFA